MWLLGRFLLGGHRFDSRLRHLGGGGGVPMMDRFLPRHGSIRRATRFYPVVTPATFSCEDSMVSRRRSVCAAAEAR
ncbi:hypothetical protein Hanom_Chr02g00115991 [Helianthus anomalus]